MFVFAVFVWWAVGHTNGTYLSYVYANQQSKGRVQQRTVSPPSQKLSIGSWIRDFCKLRIGATCPKRDLCATG